MEFEKRKRVQTLYHEATQKRLITMENSKTVILKSGHGRL